MPSYKLEYFDCRGRGETTRMLLTLAGQKFEDIRYSAKQWPGDVQSKLPTGQLPLLKEDDKQLIDSAAMSSYLAREFGFYGANSWEAAQVDQINGVVCDLWTPLVKSLFIPDEAAKAAKQKEVFDGKAHLYLKFLEDELCKNNEGNGFFVGDKISLADLNFHTAMETIEKLAHPDKNLEKYTKLAALKARISAHEGLAAYLSARPECDY